MKIELKYMVSYEDTGVIVAGFNSAEDCFRFCSSFDPVMRITTINSRNGLGFVTLDVYHNNADSLIEWAKCHEG